MKKLGDKIEKVAKPIAQVLDRAIGTDLKNCKDCAAVKELLNDGKFIEALKKRLGLA